jgi:hypothetical protein
MKIISPTGRIIIPIKIEEFCVIQDNRKKDVIIAHYEHSVLGMRTMSFLNGVESYLNPRGRYVMVQSDSSRCYRFITDAQEQEQREKEALLEAAQEQVA